MAGWWRLEGAWRGGRCALAPSGVRCVCVCLVIEISIARGRDTFHTVLHKMSIQLFIHLQRIHTGTRLSLRNSDTVQLSLLMVYLLRVLPSSSQVHV